MADSTTGELQAVSVGDLPLAPDIYDETKIPVEQNGEARHMTGAQWKAYGVAATKEEADRAEKAAVHQPVIQGGTWWVWSQEASAYVDTKVKAVAQDGVGVKSVYFDESTEVGNFYRVTLTNGTYYRILAPIGPKGDDGVTPHIGENGNWFIGEVDTGVPASGGGSGGGTGNVSSTNIDTIVVLDQNEYDALTERPSTTFYAIRG